MSKKYSLPHRSIITVSQEGDVARIILSDATDPGSPRHVSEERLATSSVIDRVVELRDEMTRVGARPEVWIDVGGHLVYTTTVPVPASMHDARHEVQVAGALTAASLDPASAPDTSVRAVVVGGRCHVAATPTESLGVWESALEGGDGHLVPRAVGLWRLLERSHHAEVAVGTTLAMSVTGDTLAAVWMSDGVPVAVMQWSLEQLASGSIARHGRSAPPELESREEAVLGPVTDEALARLRDHLVELSVGPARLDRVYLTGSHCKVPSVAAAIRYVYGADLRIEPLCAARAIEMATDTDEQKQRAREILDDEHRLSSLFGVIATAVCPDPSPVFSNVTESPVAEPKWNLYPLAALGRSALLPVGLWTAVVLSVFVGLHFYVVRQVADANAVLARENEQAAEFHRYALERAEKEAQARHQRAVLVLVDRERAGQPVPIELLSDLLACYRQVPPPPPVAGGPRSELSFSLVAWNRKSRQATISGTTNYQENARALARILGNHRGAAAFSSLIPEIAEVAGKVTADDPNPWPTYTFTFTATYTSGSEPAPTPPPQAPAQPAASTPPVAAAAIPVVGGGHVR